MTSGPPRALAPRSAAPSGAGGAPRSYPLPAGMRDLLPEEARQRRALARRVLDHFALHGFHLVTPPAFELALVLVRGLGALDASDVLRFVEPESGEVAALRPDMTPQIARMVATRLAREPLPIRLCYEGTIVRRRQGRARRHRQVPQAGVELYGLGAIDGDVEVLRLAASVVRAVGLERFVLDVGHAGIARALLEPLPAALATALTESLVQKDASGLDERLRRAPVPAATARAIAALPDLHGGSEVFARARAALGGTAAEAALAELESLWEAARRDDERLAAVLRADLGEVRGFAYYTGPIFHLLADGPGEPIGAGGRYDDLLARFDAPMPAVGFALQLDAVAWARDAAAIADVPPPRALVSAAVPGAAALTEALRSGGVAAVAHDGDLDAYAAAWGFTHVVAPAAPGEVEIRSTGAGGRPTVSRRVAGAAPDLCAALVEMEDACPRS